MIVDPTESLDFDFLSIDPSRPLRRQGIQRAERGLCSSDWVDGEKCRPRILPFVFLRSDRMGS